ncbi:Fatty acid oxidation complex subunit alpha [Zhongshania aliphaticivorans]|uniref:3-hydroxyisobutyryl-CoA hydrolase n=1 Tax=Zhongshania aliphaticivorans TaxID=1470434 RepID=A0A5S9PZM6_9GAMM|nr:enoyl-CoA hydratase/isomerase family protein [Zhongshania aliphaticivorans]CAA0092891.1 Fatty acid oxidation complex subunit alpha [Zhongshania aliphaticivorans]CAA0110501.1 Fatty acid oxidation complex subunit alpha [Zhongshania aliphaticivorans]
MTELFEEVVFEERRSASGPAVGVITLSVEKTLNSLTLNMVELMLAKLREWRERSDIACVFIHGAGQKALCAGGDVQALYKSSISQPGGPCEYAEAFFEQEYRVDYLLHKFDKPVIVWGHGIVMGGGMGVFAAGSYRVVTEKTRLAMPEITIGLYPDVGGSYFLNRMPDNTGLFLALTGASFNAADALYLGLAEGFIEHQYAGEVLNALTNVAWSTGVGDNQERVFEVMAEFVARSKEALPAGNVEAAAAEINALCSDDDLDTINNIIAVQSENPWIQKASATLASGSPLSARLIAEQLRRCKGLSLKAAFQAEVLLSTSIIRHSEFAEGVRALLIDKDKSPKWQHSSPAEVPDSLIEQHFAAPWAENPLNDL